MLCHLHYACRLLPQASCNLLSASRLPARLLGLGHLQSFLERGFSAFNHLGGASYFLNEIHAQESAIARRLMSGAADPFSPPFS